MPSGETITQLIERWEKSGGSEKANSAQFFPEVCDEILQVPHPEPADPDTAKNLYVFECAVTHQDAAGHYASFPDLGSFRSQIPRPASQRVAGGIGLAEEYRDKFCLAVVSRWRQGGPVSRSCWWI